MNITVRYRSCDGCTIVRKYKTLAGAQRFAWNMVGPHPEIGTRYAVSGDGVGGVTVQGATLAELFPTPRGWASVEGGAALTDDRDA